MGYFFIKKFGSLRKKYYLCSVIKVLTIKTNKSYEKI